MNKNKLLVIGIIIILTTSALMKIRSAKAESLNTLTLEFLGYENNAWKIKYSISIPGLRSSSGIVEVQESMWDPSEKDYVEVTIAKIGALSRDELFSHSRTGKDYIITIKAPSGYRIFAPFIYRYKVIERNSRNLKVRVPYSEFFDFVRYEAIIVYNPLSVKMINVSNIGVVIYTSDVLDDFAEKMGEVLERGRSIMLSYLGSSPLAPRCVLISGPSHHRSYPEWSMHSIGGTTVYVKLWGSKNIDYSWYVKNLLHELAHGWYTWPLINSDFDFGEGGAEFSAWYFGRILYPELYGKYEDENIQYRIKNREKYAIAAIKHQALNYFIRRLSSILGYNLTIFNLTQYIIKHNLELVLSHNSPQGATLAEVTMNILPKFLAEITGFNKQYLSVLCQRAWQVISENLEYTTTYPYFKKEAIDSIISSVESCNISAIVFISNKLEVVFANFEDYPVAVVVYVKVGDTEFSKKYEVPSRNMIISDITNVGEGEPEIKIFYYNLIGEKRPVEKISFIGRVREVSGGEGISSKEVEVEEELSKLNTTLNSLNGAINNITSMLNSILNKINVSNSTTNVLKLKHEIKDLGVEMNNLASTLSEIKSRNKALESTLSRLYNIVILLIALNIAILVVLSVFIVVLRREAQKRATSKNTSISKPTTK